MEKNSVKFCLPKQKVPYIIFICRFYTFLAHCVCNRCVAKRGPPGPLLSKNCGGWVGPEPPPDPATLPPPGDAPMSLYLHERRHSYIGLVAYSLVEKISELNERDYRIYNAYFVQNCY